MRVSITIHELDEATAGRLLHTLADMGLAEDERSRAAPQPPGPAADAGEASSSMAEREPEGMPFCPQHGMAKRQKSQYGDGYYCSAKVGQGPKDYCAWRWPPPKSEGLTQRLRGNAS